MFKVTATLCQRVLSLPPVAAHHWTATFARIALPCNNDADRHQHRRQGVYILAKSHGLPNWNMRQEVYCYLPRSWCSLAFFSLIAEDVAPLCNASIVNPEANAVEGVELRKAKHEGHPVQNLVQRKRKMKVTSLSATPKWITTIAEPFYALRICPSKTNNIKRIFRFSKRV